MQKLMLARRIAGGLALLIAALLLTACATTGDAIVPAAHDNLDAVTWQQTSGEYAAVTLGIYAGATAALETIGDDTAPSARGRAIVLDVDETVLDNVPYQAQLVLDDDSYGSETWDRWIEQRAARATPGAVAFIQAAQLLGFHVVFITNRSCRPRDGASDPCPQHEDTLVNLQKVGIDTDSTTLMLRGERPPERCRQFLSDDERESGTWSSVKTSRRECIAIDDDIVMLFGDQLGDFPLASHEDTAGAGRNVATQQGAHWGRHWFMLPNPTYGEWNPGSSEEKRSLMRGTD